VPRSETWTASALRERLRSRPRGADIVTSLWRHYGWQTELFFRWIKQHLRIKSFYGTSPNAVKTQVWIAISIYVLVAIIRKELNVEHSLHEILQILSVSLFE
jgi:IS4 transposase